MNFFYSAEILVKNREKLKESESFVLNLQKDKINNDENKYRFNIKKILSLDEALNKTYSKVIIELKKNYKIEEIKKNIIEYR